MEDITETDALFTSRTVDEVAAFSRDTQLEIVRTQEELRKLIGLKYRELLDCCDLVVGMDAVCDQIQARWNQIRSAPQVQSTKPRQQPLDTISEQLNELQRSSFSAVLLLRCSRLKDGVLEYKQSSKTIEELSDIVRSCGGQQSMLENVKRVVELVPSEFLSKVTASIQKVAALHSSRSCTEFYDDLHAAVEVWYGCSRNQAIDHVLQFHFAAISAIIDSNQSGIEKARLFASVASRGIGYIAQFTQRSVVGCTSSKTTGGLSHLLTLNPTDPDYEHTLMLSVCGFGGLDNDSRAIQEGWVSPMPPVPPPISPDVAMSFVTEVASKLSQAVFGSAEVGIAIKAESTMLDTIESLSWVVPTGDERCASSMQMLSRKVTEFFTAFVTNSAVSNFLVAADNSAAGINSIATDQDLQDAKEPTAKSIDPVQALLRQCRSDRPISKRDRSPTDPLSSAAMDIRLSIARHESVCSNDAALECVKAVREALNRICECAKRAGVALRKFSEQQRCAKALKVAVQLRASVTACELAGVPVQELSRTLEECRQLQSALHEPWAQSCVGVAQETMASGIRSLVCSSKANSSLELKIRWTSTQQGVDGLDCPSRPSPWVFAFFQQLRHVANACYPSIAIGPEADRILRLQAKKLFLEVEAPHQDACEDSLLQLYFDMNFCLLAVDDHCRLPSAQDLSLIRSRLDQVTLALLTKTLDANCVECFHSTRLALGIVSDSVEGPRPSRQEPRRMPQARDAARITNVPLPTAPKPLARLPGPSTSNERHASPHGVNPQEQSSSTSQALKGLRSMIAGWQS